MEKIMQCRLCGSKKIEDFDAEIDLSRCPDCGYIFVNPQPTKEAIKKYYSNNDNYTWWQKSEEGFNKLSKRRLSLVLRYKQRGKLLDVGAGIGQFLNFAKKYFNVTGTEVATSAIKVAKEKYKLQLIEGEVEKMELNNKYDVITLFHVLEHVHDPGLLLRKCRSLLAPGGIIVIAVPNDINKFVKRRLKQLLRFLKIGRFQHYGRSGLEKVDLSKPIGEIHLSQFTERSIRKYFLQNSYSILLESLDPYFVGDGMKQRVKFTFFNIIKKIFGVNLYDTMLYVIQGSKEK